MDVTVGPVHRRHQAANQFIKPLLSLKTADAFLAPQFAVRKASSFLAGENSVCNDKFNARGLALGGV
jgi:hypothetical protein